MNPDSQATAAAKCLVRCTLVWLLFGVGGGLLVLWRPTAFLPAVAVAAGLWLLFTSFVLYFFRDPTPDTPTVPEAIVSPAHGRVDVVDEINEPEFIGGSCRRVSVSLSVLDVHVQNAPVAGRVVCVKHQPGQFLNAMRTESAQYNENQLIGMASTEAPGERVAVRQIAGFIARRVVAWVKEGDAVARGQRLGLIQFGSRCDLYLPLSTEIAVRPGDKVVGGVTIVARRPLSPRSRILEPPNSLRSSQGSLPLSDPCFKDSRKRGAGEGLQGDTGAVHGVEDWGRSEARLAREPVVGAREADHRQPAVIL